MKFLFLFFCPIIFCACQQEGKKYESPKIARYSFENVESKTYLSDIEAIFLSKDTLPILFAQKLDKTIVADFNSAYFFREDLAEEKIKQQGLGLSLKFYEPTKEETKVRAPLKMSSTIMTLKNNRLLVKEHYGVEATPANSIIVFSYSLCMKCIIEEKGHSVSCQVSCNENQESNHLPIEVWRDDSTPLVEISNRSYSGIYAVNKNGALIFFTRNKKRNFETKKIHTDKRFTPNSEGKYFINSSSDSICIMDEDNFVYCAESSLLEDGVSQFGLFSSSFPSLKKIHDEPLSFNVEEVAFGGRHFCLRDSRGFIWCKGDNGCGQIDGKVSARNFLKDFEKISFLKDKAQQVVAHASGTCALLENGRIQCWGLGATVKRKRLLPDKTYRRDFLWYQGFRPYKLCLGGAVNGI